MFYFGAGRSVAKCFILLLVVIMKLRTNNLSYHFSSKKNLGYTKKR